MSIRFDHPEWLVLLVLSVPAVVLGLRWLIGMSPVRRWSAVAARVGLIALITGMLSGATAVRVTERLAVVAVVDVSGSVRRLAEFGTDPSGRVRGVAEVARDFLQRASKSKRPDDLLGIVAFDSSAIAVATPTRADVLTRELDVTTGEGTNIAEALGLAAALFPPDATKRILLISDGNQTTGDALEAARRLGPTVGVAGKEGVGGIGSGQGVTVDVAPVVYSVAREVVVESVDAPAHAPPDTTISVRVVLRATTESKGTLRLMMGDEEVDLSPEASGSGRRLMLKPGRTVETISVHLPAGRVHKFRAIYEPDAGPARGDGSVAYAGDSILTNNSGETFTITAGKGAVLIVDGVSGGDPTGPGALLGRTLSQAGMDVRTIPAAGMPADPLALQPYDLVILQNVPADALSRAQHTLLASYVSDLGGGLVMVGGPESFGAGGWKGTDIEPVLPVRLDLPDKVLVPTAAIVLVLDDSGSMSRPVLGTTLSQQDVANQGAALAVKSLDKTDHVGVIVFNSSFETLVPLGPNTDPERTASKIMQITPDGGTEIGPAMEEAFVQIRESPAQVRHVILLTDGISNNRKELPELAARMAAEGIGVSTIAVGDSADAATLQTMASRGGGTFYRVMDPNLLPRVFVKAVRIVRSPMIREARIDPVVVPTGSAVMEGVGRQIPPLRGMTLTQARQDAMVDTPLLAASGEPLLAIWNAGLGRVAAFMSDAHAKWAREWVQWPGYRRMWTQMVRAVARPAADRSAELTTEVVGDVLKLRLDATGKDGRPLDLLTVPAKVYTPEGAIVETRLSQTGPGVYEGWVAAPASGNYVAVLTPRQGVKPLAPVMGGAARATGTEYRALSTNLGLLRDIAEATGGRVLDLRDPETADLFSRVGVRPSEARRPLWRDLLVWTLVVLLLDVGTRRIAWDRFVSARFGADARRAAKEAVEDRSERAAGMLSALRERPAADAAVPTAGEGDRRTLSTDDARKIVKEAAVKRRDAGAAAKSTRPAKPVADVKKPEVGSSEGGTTSGLFAAKRRAQQKIEEEKRLEEERGRDDDAGA